MDRASSPKTIPKLPAKSPMYIHSLLLPNLSLESCQIWARSAFVRVIFFLAPFGLGSVVVVVMS
uniref:Uncharacterized protein n=1 Tax=Oryza brachyantha TaxID=4533 RepID=J3M6J1_ORYBR